MSDLQFWLILGSVAMLQFQIISIRLALHKHHQQIWSDGYHMGNMAQQPVENTDEA